MIANYAELHCLTNFSFLRGASHPNELVERADALGYEALAITDECSVAGVVRAHTEAKQRNIKLIIGSEFRLDDGLRCVLLATNRAGYGQLCRLITRARSAAKKGEYHIERDFFEEAHRQKSSCYSLQPTAYSLSSGGSEDGVRCTADGVQKNPPAVPDAGAMGPGAGARDQKISVSGPSLQPPASSLPPVACRLSPVAFLHDCLALWLPGAEPNPEEAAWLKRCFPERTWIAVELLCAGDDRRRLAHLEQLGQSFEIPLVACGDVHTHLRERQELQDVLTAIRLGVPVGRLGTRLFPNGERHLRPIERLQKIYPEYLLQESLKIARRCKFKLDEISYEYPDELVPAGETPTSYLRRLTDDGQRRKWPSGTPPEVATTIERELKLIEDLKYEPFFLTVYEIVSQARQDGILCQGRGSAANSMVCFCLGITNVSPDKGGKNQSVPLFERFVSRERKEPPDIDVDFEHERREEVIQWIYGKYGRHRAALAATVITYQPRSAIRDLGKALGLDPWQVDRLARTMQWWDGNESGAERIKEAGMDPANPVLRRLFAMTRELCRFPRHLSQHVGGFVIARHSLPELVPIENAAMPDRTVIQWDKDDLEELKLLKVDVLGLGMLTVLRKSFEFLQQMPEAPHSLEEIPLEDAATYEMIQKADTVGVFQIESRAQMSMLPRLKPKNFYDLVVEVAIVRPGPIQGDMVHPYLRRREGLEPVEYPGPEIKEVLERTLGVPIFQEQVMQIAIKAAGFTNDQADKLRRAMASWQRNSDLGPFEQQLVSGMVSRGYQEEFARRIFKQIEGFGEYGFPEAHAASFAELVYASAWLKCHHPAVFTAALLNSQPMGFYAPAQLVRDAREHNVEVRNVDVQFSDYDATLEQDLQGRYAVRLGLRLVKGIGEAAVAHLVQTRQCGGPYASVQQLVERTALTRRDLHALAAAGALASLAGNRHQAVWNVSGVEAPLPVMPEIHIAEATPLLKTPSEAQNIVADYHSLGLTLGRHPLALLRRRLERERTVTASDLKTLPSGMEVRVTGLVIGRQRPGKGNVIFVTLEDETGQANVIVWQSVAERQRKALLHSRLLQACGTLQREGAVIHVVARRLLDRSRWLGALEVSSRDFH